MRNIKIEKTLIGSDWWKSTSTVEAQGDPNAAVLPKGLNQEEKEKMIQSWKSIAILEVNPKNVPFYIGFKNGSYLAILKCPIETENGRFGMRIGRSDVEFFVIDKNLEKEIKLNLVEIATESDMKYQELPLY